jgi:hypothetical protein
MEDSFEEPEWENPMSDELASNDDDLLFVSADSLDEGMLC